MGAQRWLSVERLEALGRKAVQAGCTVEVWHDLGLPRRLIRWDVSGGCTSPVVVEQFARYSAQHGKAVKPLCVILETQCRDCGWCREQRRKRWAARAMAEYGQSVRTWFVTLTVEPEWRTRFEYQCYGSLSKKGVDFDGLSTAAKFAALVQYGGGRELTRFVKRLRTNAAAPFRYLVVAEKHGDGSPHFHMLVHEVDEARPVRKRTIQDAWQVGYSKVILCNDAKGAVYLCKYLSKDACTRVRASFKYGGAGGLAETTGSSVLERSERF